MTDGEFNVITNLIGHLEFLSVEDFEEAIEQHKIHTMGSLHRYHEFVQLAPRSQSSTDVLIFDQKIKMFARIIIREKMKFARATDRPLYQKILDNHLLEIFGELGT